MDQIVSCISPHNSPSYNNEKNGSNVRGGLRPYQTKAVDDFEQTTAAGRCKILLVCPTGGGKTLIACELIRRANARYQRSLFLAHRREIIQQTSDKLGANGIAHGIIMAGIDPRPMAPVQVASIDTLRVRAMNSDAMAMPLANLVILDEAHHARAETYTQIVEAYPDATILGLTATPCRGDGRGLGNIFEVMIECPQVPELIALGFLVGTKVYAPVDPNLKGVRTQSGDYVINQLAGRMNTDELVGDIITHWIKYGEHRRTVVFAVDVAHSVHIAGEFIKAGIRAEHLDGRTPIPDRAAILARLASGETEVVSNCMVLTEGWDMPEVGCCVLARPTKQMGLYRQMIGRVLRPAPGKSHAIILDHSGAVFRHGLPEEHVEWTLDVDRRAEAPAHERRKRGGGPKLRECPSCHVLMLAPPCGNCGWQPQRRAQSVDFADGELGLVIGGRARPAEYGAEERQRWHAMFVYIARERGYKQGWIAHRYKQKFGAWPRGVTPDPIAPSPEVRSWVRSRDIAYAKSRRREVA
jgi:superfamily II DNA or RNA helicase